MKMGYYSLYLNESGRKSGNSDKARDKACSQIKLIVLHGPSLLRSCRRSASGCYLLLLRSSVRLVNFKHYHLEVQQRKRCVS